MYCVASKKEKAKRKRSEQKEKHGHHFLERKGKDMLCIYSSNAMRTVSDATLRAKIWRVGIGMLTKRGCQSFKLNHFAQAVMIKKE